MYKKYSIAAGAALAVGLAGVVAPAVAKVEGDTIVIGSSLSLTGKYSTNGFHTQKGYDFAVKRINDTGGVKVGGKSYKLKVVYYDDESTPSRASQLTERLVKTGRREIYAWSLQLIDDKSCGSSNRKI